MEKEKIETKYQILNDNTLLKNKTRHQREQKIYEIKKKTAKLKIKSKFKKPFFIFNQKHTKKERIFSP